MRVATLALVASVVSWAGTPPVTGQQAGNPAAATPAVDFVQAQTLEQVVSGWRPDKSVFVIGELSRTPVPIDPQALRDLAGELNGKHWAVVIVLDASGLDGRSFALKLRIPLFGGRMPADGKIFLVGFTQKGQSGEVQAHFACSALNTAAFEHNIDRWFKPAVQKNGDVVGAIRAFTKNIDALIDVLKREPADAKSAVSSSLIDLESLVQFLLTVEILGLAVWPLTRHLFNELPDRGWAFSKIIGILLVSWVVWLLGSFKWFEASFEICLAIVILVAAPLWFFLRVKKGLPKKEAAAKRKALQVSRKFILLEEVLFSLVFLVWTFFRLYTPNLYNLEKFMDFGFINSILRGSFLPPKDHFLGGEVINYYYFGHFIAAVLFRLSRVPPSIAYHLQMSNLMALTFVESFAIGSGIYFLSSEANRQFQKSKAAIASGVVTACFITLFGNFHGFFYSFFDRSRSYSYPEATRFIRGCIHEFPIYSFVVNDLHAHVSDLPITLFMIAVGFCLFRDWQETPPQLPFQRKGWLGCVFPKRSGWYFLVFSITVGLAFMTNAWDFTIYLLLLGLIIWISSAQAAARGSFPGRRLLSPKVLFLTAVLSGLALAISISVGAPFWKHFASFAKGVALVPSSEHSPFWQLAILWGLQVVPVTLFVVHALRKSTEDASKRYLVLLSFVGAFLVLLPELIYFKDIYSAGIRANTMFKFYYQAWLLWGTVAGVAVAFLWQSYKSQTIWFRVGFKALVAFLVFSGFVYTYHVVHDGVGVRWKLPQTSGLDGKNYLARTLPFDAKAIDWINLNISGQPIIVEAVGASFTQFARIATFTGLPTVLGWPLHEWLWRGSMDDSIRPRTTVERRYGIKDTINNRLTDVETLYSTQDLGIAQKILDKYDVEYVYVGELEKIQYPTLAEQKFKSLAKTIVYDENEVRIYKIR